MEKEQNSVEWLSEIIRFANKELYAEMFDEIEQAKAMHKKEHEKTWNVNKYSSFDEYYEKTFNK
jgi:hypothetical protein